MPAAAIKPNWCFIRFDESSDWELPANIKPYVAKVYGIYAFDRNTHTHCCEITPSYYLQAMAWDWDFTDLLDKLPERERERMMELISDTINEARLEEGGGYYHVSYIEKLIAGGQLKFHEAGDIVEDPEEEYEALADYWNPNPRF